MGINWHIGEIASNTIKQDILRSIKDPTKVVVGIKSIILIKKENLTIRIFGIIYKKPNPISIDIMNKPKLINW